MRALLLAVLALPLCVQGQPLPIFDAHLHYSHDAWELVPGPQAIEILRKAGVNAALIPAPATMPARLYPAAPTSSSRSCGRIAAAPMSARGSGTRPSSRICRND